MKELTLTLEVDESFPATPNLIDDIKAAIDEEETVFFQVNNHSYGVSIVSVEADA